MKLSRYAAKNCSASIAAYTSHGDTSTLTFFIKVPFVLVLIPARIYVILRTFLLLLVRTSCT